MIRFWRLSRSAFESKMGMEDFLALPIRENFAEYGVCGHLANTAKKWHSVGGDLRSPSDLPLRPIINIIKCVWLLQAAASREHVGKPARRLLPDPSKCRKQQQQQGYVSTTSGSKTSYSDQPSDTTQAHTLTTLRYPQQHRRPDSDRAKCYRQQ